MNTNKKYKKHTGYWIDKYVQENSCLRMAERIILGDIITVHKSTKSYFKSNDRLSLITGLSKRAVQNVLKSLKDKGYIFEPKQIRSSAIMTVRRVITPNIPFAIKMYEKQLELLKDNVEVSKSTKSNIDNVSEIDNTVQLDVSQGAVLNTSGCSTLHTENTLENNRTHTENNIISRILSGEEAKVNPNKESKGNNWFDELVNSGVKVKNNPPIPTDIPPDTEQSKYDKGNKAYKADQSGDYDSEVIRLKEFMF